MHTRHCLKIAERIGALLQHEIGEGIDTARLLRDARYARDVLLVCEALSDTAGPLLARAFRRALARPDEPQAAGPGWLRALLGAPAPARPGPSQARTQARPQALARRSSSPPSATWSPTP